MPLESGARLGSYEVVGSLGAGGMGEVYRARDVSLDRDVALKVLPELFATDPERRARFEREAKLLASLNHPHIAQVYGAGVDDRAYIAMELVEGDDLSALISRGPLGLEQALAVSRQIASALESAHEQGIVHRDLKPANVKVREDGTVKVLDFGLAKALAVGPEAASSGVSDSPTLTAHSTQLGMILGTAAYMSPEQAKGRGVDRRADVWAFGVVLFEMLAGRRAFEGEDVSEVLAAVLKTEPDWTMLPADLPAPVRRLLGRCLEKDPKKRLRDVSEGVLQMDEALATASSGVASAPDAGSRAWWWRPLPVAAVTALIVAAGVHAGVNWATPAAVPAEAVRFTFEPAQVLFRSADRHDFAISPDGRSIVLVTIAQGQPMLYVRRLDQLEEAPLRGTEAGMGPFFSPDSQWVGFVDSTDPSTVKKVPANGGPAITICKVATAVLGAAWLPDGTIVVGVQNHPLMWVRDAGGTPEPLVEPDPDAKEQEHLWPSAIPGTSLVLFVVSDGIRMPLTGGELAVIDLTTRRLVRSGISGTAPRFVSTGHVLYAVEDGSVRAIAFDPDSVAFSGSPAPVLDSVGVKSSGAANFDLSRDGRLVHAAGGAGVARTLVWADRAGREDAIAAPARNYFYARVSPDGRRLSLDVRDEEQDIWIWDLARETMTRLTDKAGPDQYGLWTPDGEQIVFSSLGAGRNELFWHRPDGVGSPEQITDTSAENLTPFPNAITADGKQVIFRAVSRKNDLFVVDIAGDRKVTPLLSTEHDERNAALSPDGGFMAFESDLSGRIEVYVRPFPDVNSRQWPVSTAGGAEPVWSPTGRELFYVSTAGQMMSVPVTISPAFELGRPVALFDASLYYFGGTGRNYDVGPDGRFVLVRNPGSVDAATPITVVVNWLEEFRARLR